MMLLGLLQSVYEHEMNKIEAPPEPVVIGRIPKCEVN